MKLAINALPLAGGGRFDLQREGSRLLVVYKESCPTCRLLLPVLEEVYRLSGRVLPVLLVSQDDSRATAATAMALGISMPVLLDAPAYELSCTIGLAGVPVSVLLDSGGLGEPVEGFDRVAIRDLAASAATAQGLDRDILSPFDSDDLPDFRPG